MDGEWFTTLLKNLPNLKRRVQLTGLIVGLAAFIITRAVSPDAIVAQVAAGGLGVIFLIFAQVLSNIKDYPEAQRVDLTLKLCAGFAVLFLAVLGLVIGFAKPTAANPDWISIGSSQPRPLDFYVGQVAAEKNVTIVFAPSCSANVKATVISAGTHTGNNVRDFLQKIRLRAEGASPNYSVNSSGERYEIVCS